MTINGFEGEYAFLSNFYPSKIFFEGLEYPTVEHAFQASKVSLVNEWHILTRLTISKLETPGQAKRFGRKVVLRSNWDEIKIDIMLELLRLKFSIPELREKLLATSDKELIENNNWGDIFWGVCNGVGENNLGNLLMLVRFELQGQELEQ